MDKVFEKIAKLPAQIKLGVLAGSLVVIALICLGLVVAFKSKDKVGEKAEQAQLNQALADLEQVKREKAQDKNECERLKKDLKKAKRKVKRFRGMLPNTASISTLIMDIKAKLSGLELISYARQEEKKLKRRIREIPLDLRVRGPFHAALRFFHELAIMPRIVNVTNVTMSNPTLLDGKAVVNLTFKVSTFRYKKKKKKKGRKSKKGSKA